MYQQHMLHQIEPDLPDIVCYAYVATSCYHLRQVQSGGIRLKGGSNRNFGEIDVKVLLH